MYPYQSILFRGSVPVPISGTDCCKKLKIFGRQRQRGAGMWSSNLLKELSELFGRKNENDRRCAGDVAPGVACVRGNMYVIVGFSFDPCMVLAVLPQSL